MEKLSERIGLYDLWVVFFPGLVSTLELLFFCGILWSLYCKRPLLAVLKKIPSISISVWIVIIVFSFFFGIVLQETGHWLRKIAKYKSSKEVLLDPSAGVLSNKEQEYFKNLFIEYGWGKGSPEGSKELFHQINAKAQECGIATKYVKLNVLQNMSLSLSSAMLFGAIVSFALVICAIIHGRVHIAILMTVLTVIFIILMILFFGRFKRFDRYWVRNIIYAVSTKMLSEKA